MIIGVVFLFCIKWRKDNARQGAGPEKRGMPATTEYVTPMGTRQPAPLPPITPYQEDDPQGTFLGQPDSPYQRPNLGTQASYNPGALPPADEYQQVHIPGIGTGLAPLNTDPNYLNNTHPATREIDDFSRAYSDANIGQSMDDDRAPLTAHADDHQTNYTLPSHYGDTVQSASGDSNNRPLWQQNRHQSRNLMWM
jgi:hypothetical protein